MCTNYSYGSVLLVLYCLARETSPNAGCRWRQPPVVDPHNKPASVILCASPLRVGLSVADPEESAGDLTTSARDPRPVVICGFGELGQTVANMLESPLAVSLESRQLPYIAFDQSVERVKNARAAGFNVVYGNGSAAVSLPQFLIRPRHSINATALDFSSWTPDRGCGTRTLPKRKHGSPTERVLIENVSKIFSTRSGPVAQVLHAAGVEEPRALVLVYTARARLVSATKELREAYPEVPIYARCTCFPFPLATCPQPISATGIIYPKRCQHLCIYLMGSRASCKSLAGLLTSRQDKITLQACQTNARMA